MTDRLFRNALLNDGRQRDFAVSAGRFVDVTEITDTSEVVDLEGLLVLPGLVDGHIHLDKSFVSDRWRPHEPANNLRERIAIEKRLLAEALPIADRAEALIMQAHAFGTIAMRSHVDVDATTGLANLHAVMDVCTKWKDRVSIELVAFPQSGILTCSGTADILEAGIREGAQVIGGIDPSALDGDADKHLDIVFGIAERHGVKVDIHLHEHGCGGIRQLERIALRTAALGMAGRVTVSHAYALGEIAMEKVKPVAAILADSGVAILTTAPGDRAFPPIALLKAEGVLVFAGNDNIRDSWRPYGNGDMLQRAMLIGYRSGFYTDEDLSLALQMVTTEAARALSLENYGINIGNEATFMILDAANAAAAVAAPPMGRIVVRRGEITHSSLPSISQNFRRA